MTWAGHMSRDRDEIKFFRKRPDGLPASDVAVTSIYPANFIPGFIWNVTVLHMLEINLDLIAYMLLHNVIYLTKNPEMTSV